jgi:hypothetical protein
VLSRRSEAVAAPLTSGSRKPFQLQGQKVSRLAGDRVADKATAPPCDNRGRCAMPFGWVLGRRSAWRNVNGNAPSKFRGGR